VGNNGHGYVTVMVWMGKSNYWVIPISSTARMPGQHRVKMNGLRSEHGARIDVVIVNVGHRRRVDQQGSNENRSERADDANGVHGRC